jgi:DNA processing protein
VDPHLLLAAAEGFGEGPVGALLDPSLDALAALGNPPPDLPPRVLARLCAPGLHATAAAFAAGAHAAGLAILTPDSPAWPPRLRHAPLRPLVLFARGDLGALAHQPAATVVGSRTPTPYGLHAAQEFAGALAAAGVVLWSGLARGIDAAAHRACLRARTPTVAVLAGGLDAIYPPEHRALAESIVLGGGCLLAELPPGRRARRGHFPRRNRILAAGTATALVVEAGLASGALHTAHFAAECGASVFAVPGPWQSERSRGCHRLLQEGAGVAADPADLLRELGVLAHQPAAAAHALQLSADAQALLGCLKQGPRPADLVLRQSGLPRAAFLLARLHLERDGLLRSLPGDLLAATSR